MSRDIFIVGASRGIGRALVDVYSGRGHSVFAFARSNPEVRGREIFSHCDVASLEVDDMLARKVRGSQGPRLVVVTAAVLGPVGPIGGTDRTRWEEAVRTNLVGAANVLRVLAPLVGSDDRVVLFMGGGIGGPRLQPYASAYTACKAAIAVLIEEVARDDSFSAPLIGLAPGAFPTDFADEVLRVGPKVAGDILFEQVTEAKKSTFDLSSVINALDYIVTAEGAALDGRIVSAQRDNLSQISSLSLSSEDAFRLRRVDNQVVQVVAPW